MKKIEAMRTGGKITVRVLRQVIEMAEPGVPLIELDRHAETLIREAGGTPSFQTVSGYDWATCINVNNEVVHGVPDDYELERGDLLSVDLGTLYQGYHTDSATTVFVGSEPSEELRRFLEVGKQALSDAIGQATPGNRVGDISAAIESVVTGAGFTLVRELVGHGVGKQLHESPQIPGSVREPRDQTPVLETGQGLAIEVIYAQENADIEIDKEDNWTVFTQDGSLAAVFEHTVVVLDAGNEVVTRVED